MDLRVDFGHLLVLQEAGVLLVRDLSPRSGLIRNGRDYVDFLDEPEQPVLVGVPGQLLEQVDRLVEGRDPELQLVVLEDPEAGPEAIDLAVEQEAVPDAADDLAVEEAFGPGR